MPAAKTMVRAMRLTALLSLALGACTTFPALDGTISDAARQAPYPDLTAVPLAPAATGAEEDVLSGRIAALEARAARIRQIDIGALQ
ncbi:hypothetical protein [Loktanella sp. Alg231-35]|uniref:hypothetical protein n=1 Tax=Loktanella sp. Alg231-35 TaxID=1922220 RepID=UPI001F1ADD9D|nr:hypothetical protein [Loktanella sp. Alg231-35]